MERPAPATLLKRIRIVLARPIRPGNVGAAARAMANMGLSDLCLVAPACDTNDEPAQGFAARAKPLLDAARVAESLPTALADCVKTFATSGKGGMYRRQAAVTPWEGARLALEAAANGPVAIAFGPEDRGLLQGEILDFDHVIEIPSDDGYPVLNLAAAVMVICYELRRALAAEPADAAPPQTDIAAASTGEPLATDDRKRILYDKLFNALDRIGFFRAKPKGDHLRYALRRVLGRAALTVNEADIWTGVAQQIDWYADRCDGPDLRRVD
ncbi:MAG: hypothetical protein KDA32_03735 [Phycisphaerales bacterium]|nr:hypothetical protein [Phycisphaerales bacterium]